VSALLDRREAEPFRELTSMADCEPLEPLPGIEDVMAALDLDDQVDDDLFVPNVMTTTASDDDIVAVVERLPHSAMFTHKGVGFFAAACHCQEGRRRRGAQTRGCRLHGRLHTSRLS
jgi:hypothetical protein